MTQRKFKIRGMDCAACTAKIETAVRRIDGVTEARVGLQSETLTVTCADDSVPAAIEKSVRALGYDIKPLVTTGEAHAETPWPEEATAHHHQDQDHAHDDHDGHGEPIEGVWWKSAKGLHVILTGALIGLAYLGTELMPQGAAFLFIAAAIAGAFPVARRALAALRNGSLFTIEMLMTVAVAGALAIKATEEASLVVFLFAVGELLEGVAAGRARAGIKALAAIAPKTAMLETAAGLVETPITQLAIGSVVVVRPGDRVPADGTIISGVSAVDEAVVTGESVPRNKQAGDQALAGSINVEAVLRMRVDKLATDTVIARVVKLVEEAADAKAPAERFIDQFARWYMPLICLLAVAVALVPPLVMQQAWDTWIYRALGLLLIGCPCALVISTPATITSALAAGARRGLLVKGGGVLEAIGKVKHIAFDKTGTLTNGKPLVTDVKPVTDMSEREILRISASAEAGSSHPLALAIVAHAQALHIEFEPVPSSVLPGRGLEAKVDSRAVVVGAASRIGVTDAGVLALAEELEAQGKSVAAVVVDGRPVGLIAMRDEPRSDAASGVAALKVLCLQPIMLTGDNKANAHAVGKLLGMEVQAGLLPEDKLAVIRRLAAEGGVAKVGDGINDAPALAAATVGIAMGSGTDVALEAAAAAILNNRIADVAALVRLSRKTLSVIRQNVWLALGLKAIFLVTTITGFSGLWIAIMADTGATVLVTANALQLLRARID